jgi:peptidyl-prolyl cis-trans isomerase D
VNQSGISLDAIRTNLDNNIIEELLSGLISTTLIDLEVKDFALSVSERTILKTIKDNKNFQDENGIFQRVKYEKFLLSSNLSAPMFELKLKNRELQKHLFDIIGAGTITPNFLIEKKYEENNKTLSLEYFNMEGLYKDKNEYTEEDLLIFIKENEDQLKREYVDFKYVVLNPKNLIGVEEFNQEFFDEIDKIENQISEGADFGTILETIKVKVNEIIEYAPNSKAQTSESLIYQNKSSKLNLLENGDNFLLYNINKEYSKSPNLNDDKTKSELTELIYQKDKFDFNRKILEEIQSKKFNNSRFKDLGKNSLLNVEIKTINDDATFDINSIKMLYTLPVNSFTLVNDKDNNIFLVKISDSKKNFFNKSDEDYVQFVKNQNTNNRKSILQSYDQLLNNKYEVKVNQKSVDRVKNYFK